MVWQVVAKILQRSEDCMRLGRSSLVREVMVRCRSVGVVELQEVLVPGRGDDGRTRQRICAQHYDIVLGSRVDPSALSRSPPSTLRRDQPHPELYVSAATERFFMLSLSKISVLFLIMTSICYACNATFQSSNGLEQHQRRYCKNVSKISTASLNIIKSKRQFKQHIRSGRKFNPRGRTSLPSTEHREIRRSCLVVAEVSNDEDGDKEVGDNEGINVHADRAEILVSS